MRSAFVIPFFVRIFFCGAAAGLLVTVSTPAVHAQADDEIKEARVKFQKAIELEHAKNWGGALRLFREVATVKMTPQVRYHIATCEENLGQLVAALGGYQLALAQSEEMHPDFISEVQGSIDDLTARIPKLILERGEGAEAASIELDGVALGDSSIGSETPLDPGPHTVTAKAPGYEDYQQTVTVQEGKIEILKIRMQALKKGETHRPEPGAEPVEAKGYGILPFVIGGSGIVLAATGGVFLGLSGGKVSKAQELCGGSTDCTNASAEDQASAQDLVGSAKTLEAVGWVGLGVGVAAVATGTVLFFIDPTRGKKQEAKAKLSFLAAAKEADAGLSLIGRF